MSLDISEVYGYVKCTILPPRQLYHPVLPYRCNGKMMFPLCAKCAEAQNQSFCDHSDTERGLLGTWVSEEVKMAIRFGYVLQNVWETWHYERRSRRLFRSYIQTFQKLKQEASGLNAGVQTPEQRATFVADHAAHEGVQLDPDKIAKNPGARTMLNTLWGKFGQKPNRNKTRYIHNLDEWMHLATDPKNDVHAAHHMNDGESIMVVYNLRENHLDELEDNFGTSIIIAAWTTFLARKKLYMDAFSKLKDRVCYMDTDSAIYEVHRDDSNTIRTDEDSQMKWKRSGLELT